MHTLFTRLLTFSLGEPSMCAPSDSAKNVKIEALTRRVAELQQQQQR